MAAVCRRVHIHESLDEADLCDRIGWINRQPSVAVDIEERHLVGDYLAGIGRASDAPIEYEPFDVGLAALRVFVWGVLVLPSVGLVFASIGLVRAAVGR